MDALEFLRERKRMCYSYKKCHGCPLEGRYCVTSNITSDKDYRNIIATVEQWSKEQPRKTRQSMFLEQYPEAQTDIDNVLCVCPAVIASSYRGDGNRCVNISRACSNCRYEFWMQEV